jgi:hypothetical protein
MSRWLPLVFALLLCSAPCAAGETPELFGVPLGRECAVCQGMEPEPAGDMLVYRMTLPKADPRFSAYQVRVSEKTGKVVDIAAVEVLEDEVEARGRLDALYKEFGERFGKASSKKLYRHVSHIFRPKGMVVVLLLREDMLLGQQVLYINAMDRGEFSKTRKK